jgi:hypothetical protein
MDTTDVRDAFAPQTPDQLRATSRSGGFSLHLQRSFARQGPASAARWHGRSVSVLSATLPHEAMQHVLFDSAEKLDPSSQPPAGHAREF